MPRKKTRLQAMRAGLSIVCLGMWISGCGPVADDDVHFIDDRVGSREADRALMRHMTQINSIEGAIELVQMAMAPDDFEGNTKEWVAYRRDRIDGDVMLPQWEGQRKGAHQFEVRYIHTVRDFDYRILKTGYRWQVNTLLKEVDGPEVIDPEDLAPPPRSLPDLKLLDESDDSFSLE